MPLWQILQVLSGDAFRLHHDVRVIRAFAKDIVNQRRRALDKQKQQKEQQKQVSQVEGEEQKPSSRLAVNTADADAGDVDPCDLLSMFMSATTPDGLPLTEEQLVDTVINFIIAGRDTTAQVRGREGGGAAGGSKGTKREGTATCGREDLEVINQGWRGCGY
jgi:cytochrome P450